MPMPRGNKMDTGSALRTNSMWSSVIGHDPHAAADAPPASGPGGHQAAGRHALAGPVTPRVICPAPILVHPSLACTSFLLLPQGLRLTTRPGTTPSKSFSRPPRGAPAPAAAPRWGRRKSAAPAENAAGWATWPSNAGNASGDSSTRWVLNLRPSGTVWRRRRASRASRAFALPDRREAELHPRGVGTSWMSCQSQRLTPAPVVLPGPLRLAAAARMEPPTPPTPTDRSIQTSCGPPGAIPATTSRSEKSTRCAGALPSFICFSAANQCELSVCSPSRCESPRV